MPNQSEHELAVPTNSSLDMLPVTITGRSVVLRPVSEVDYRLLYSWRVDMNFMALWHSPGRRIPTFREYLPELERFLADGITLLIADRKTAKVGAFARVYNLNPVDGWGWVQAYAAPGARLRPFQAAEAAALFANFLFDMFPLRKLYSEVSTFNKQAVRLNERLGFREHGRLPEHIWLKDRYWDMLLFSLSRKDWLERIARFRFLLGVEEEAEQILSQATTD